MLHYSFTPPRPTDKTIGHRGVAALAPENTMAGFRLAANLGIEWVEFDLRLTADEELVIFHGDDLEQTTNGKGSVHEHTVAELQKLDAGSKFHPRFHGEKIPIFSEVLPELIRLGLYLNIELKVPKELPLAHAQKMGSLLVDTLLKCWPKEQPWPFVSSFHWASLHIIRKAIPDIPIGFLAHTITSEEIEEIGKLSNVSINCNHQNLTDEIFELARFLDIPVLAYTVNDPVIAQKLFEKGIFAVFSDDPKYLTHTLMCQHSPCWTPYQQIANSSSCDIPISEKCDIPISENDEISCELEFTPIRYSPLRD